MSLRDKFKKEIYDSEQKPRLNFARNHFLGFSIDKDPDFEELEEFYAGWRDLIEYMVLQKHAMHVSNPSFLTAISHARLGSRYTLTAVS
jgi:hypothetical protein